MTIQHLWNTFAAAARLGCPRCGQRTLFRGLFSMNESCSACQLVFEREPGYFIGAIYINYAVTAILMMAGFLFLDAYAHPSLTVQLLLWGTFGVVFPLLFFRYSRSLWLAIGHLVSPEDPRPRVVGGRST